MVDPPLVLAFAVVVGATSERLVADEVINTVTGGLFDPGAGHSPWNQLKKVCASAGGHCGHMLDAAGTPPETRGARKPDWQKHDI